MATVRRPEKGNAREEKPTRQTTPRPYLSSAERERQIVHAAIGFFAENGFSGNTRELAKRLGIAHGLLFRYFPTKEDLIERVYKEVFAGHVNPEWEIALRNRTEPLVHRLRSVYTSYAATINRYEWVRIYLFAGLNGTKINSRYWGLVRENMFRYVIDELRYEHDKPPVSAYAITDAELELVWSLHAAIFYLGVRKWVYLLPLPEDMDATICQLVEALLDAAPRVIATVPASSTAAE